MIANYTNEYVVKQGYFESSIKDIEILLSYINRILGYNEWRISVEFKETPNVYFWFTYCDDKIVFKRVISKHIMNTDEVIEYSEKFRNGTLLN